MSIFASQTQVTVAIPFDVPHTVTIRKLTGREYETVCEAHRGGFASGSPRLWPTILRRALDKGASDPDVLKAIADPLTGHDRFALVRAGLLAWSYPQAIAIVPATATAPAIDAVADLDDEAVDFIATEVLRLTKPALFVEAVEDAQKEPAAAAPAV